MSIDHLTARVRRRLGQAAWRRALGPVGGAMPRRYVRSIVEQLCAEAIASHVETVTSLASAHVEHYDFDPGLPPEFRRSKAFDERFVYLLRDVCASPRTGLCWLPNGPILEESYGSLIRLLGWGDAALDEPLVRQRHRIDGPAIVMPCDGYFHWLLEALPATLHALKVEPKATIVIARHTPRYVDEALELLGLENIYRSDRPVRVEQLLLAGRDSFSGFVPREDIEILRRTFHPLVGCGAEGSVYVSRSHQLRHPANESQVEGVFKRFGYTIVASERLGFAEQIELFAGATRVAGPHGAGLANTVWSQADDMLEVFVANHFNDCYARIAISLGATYHRAQCSASPQPWGDAPIEIITRFLAEAAFAPVGDERP